MGKSTRTIIIAFVIILLFVAGFFVFGKNSASNIPSQTAQPTIQPTQEITPALTFNVTYKGETGKDALTLLKENTTVVLDASGMVSSINGRKANTAKREFWAFYVNSKMAPVGPADYQSKNGDIIGWKIETY